MLKKLLFILLLFFPLVAGAQADAPATGKLPAEFFTAEVVRILKEENVVLPDGLTATQQNLELIGLNGKHEGKQVIFDGIGEPETSANNIYEPGDKVSVQATADEQGNVRFFVTDYVRIGSIGWLAAIFIFFLLLVGRWKGLRSLISLVVTFFVVMYYILPQIIGGSDPVIVTLLGSVAILLSIIYITEGFNRTANVAVSSIFISLLATIFISWLFVNLAKLSGVSSEEVGFLISYGGQPINFKGLLLAGIIIGSLGVLDDVVISQITAVEEINNAAGGLNKQEVFKKAMKVGVSHISAMTNTLFLAYAGAALPLLVLFLSGQSAFADPVDALNNEALATEVVRTLAGSVGLILSMPISTALAVWQVKRR